MIFTQNGFRALRFVSGVTLSGIAVAAFLVAGSYWYWQAEKRNNQLSIKLQQDARIRLDTARRERDDLRDSEQTYKALSARGVFQTEQRIDLIEAFAELKKRHKLVALNYTVGPQRSIKMSGNASLEAINVYGSRIDITARGTHDGDLVALLDDFPRMQRGFFPLNRCTVSKTNVVNKSATDIVVRTTEAQEEDLADASPAALEAKCSLEWLTLVDKRSPVGVASPLTSQAATQ